ncbi:hypothetical protein DSECCO2_499790 [anaerobic digester metagenome]
MDVVARGKGVQEGRVAGHVRQDPEFDLGVVRGHEHLARRGHEAGPHARPEAAADGDVLQVGIAAGQAARGRGQLVEGRVDAPLGVGQLRQGLEVGRAQLLVHPVFEDVVDDGVLPGQAIQHGAGGGLGAAGGLLFAFEAQLRKQDVGQLLAGADVELPSGLFVNPQGQPVQLGLHHVQEIAELGLVDADAAALHAHQDLGQGLLQPLEEAEQLRPGQTRPQHPAHGQRGLTEVLGVDLDLLAQAVPDALQGVVPLLGAQQVGGQLDVEDFGAAREVGAAQLQQGLVRRHVHARPGQGPAQLRVPPHEKQFADVRAQDPAAGLAEEAHLAAGHGSQLRNHAGFDPRRPGRGLGLRSSGRNAVRCRRLGLRSR